MDENMKGTVEEGEHAKGERRVKRKEWKRWRRKDRNDAMMLWEMRCPYSNC